MWTHVQKMLGGGADGTSGAVPPAIPLRKAVPMVADIAVGKILHFSAHCPLAPLTDASAMVVAVRHYRFGDDSIKSFQLNVAGSKQYFLTVAEDAQGQYLGISRLLNEAEQDSWFGRDALSFFTEASSAKSIRCKADLMVEEAWAAARYAKTVDWVSGSVGLHESPRAALAIHYSLLVNEAGNKALEIEHEEVSGDNRFYVTVYRPVEDIVRVMAASAGTPANDDVPLFREPPPVAAAPVAELAPAAPKQRQDFRRLGEDETPIRIERLPLSELKLEEAERELPAFLLAREGGYLSLDAVIPPEAERVRVGLAAAHRLITEAMGRNVRVRDVLRDMLGLHSALSEEVIFEMPLSDDDYRTLAMRYKLRPDHRVEIRARLEEELRQKLYSF